MRKPAWSFQKGFISSFHRAIAVRRVHGANISKDLEKTEEREASDDRHSFFIGILEHVRDTLRPLMPDSLKDVDPEIKTADAEGLSNMAKLQKGRARHSRRASGD